MTESYFRVPDFKFHGNFFIREQMIKPIAFLIEPGSIIEHVQNAEKGSVSMHSLFYISNSGYRYQLGRGNNYKMDIVNDKEAIFLLASRYDSQETLNEILKGICTVLGFDYIYHYENFEHKIESSLRHHFNSNDKFYVETRLLVNKALIKLKIHESQLQFASVQDKVIQSMIEDFSR